MIRPRPARWFEALVAREDCALLLEALAATGLIELETRSAAALPPYFEEMRSLLQQFSDLARRYRDYWPASGLRPSAVHDAPAKILADVLERLGHGPTRPSPPSDSCSCWPPSARNLRCGARFWTQWTARRSHCRGWRRRVRC